MKQTEAEVWRDSYKWAQDEIGSLQKQVARYYVEAEHYRVALILSQFVLPGLNWLFRLAVNGGLTTVKWECFVCGASDYLNLYGRCYDCEVYHGRVPEQL